MQQPIRGYSQDEDGHWVAWLACGHRQHVRHCPPRESREWVLSAEGRASRLGLRLGCRKCEAGLPPDAPPGGAAP
jgi:hypothetical protein